MIIAQCAHDITTSYGLTISLFLAGLVGGFTHCAGMCSPFVLAQVSGSSEPVLKKLSASLLLPYHLGRMTTYIFLAVIANGAIVFIFSDLKAFIAAPLLMLAGVLFLVSAFPKLINIFPWVLKIRVYTPYGFINKAFAYFTKNPNIFKRYILGVLLGFIPCGLVFSALLASVTAPDILHAGVAMGAFTLGTIPALIIVAFGGQMLKHKYPNMTSHLSRVAMTLSSVWLFILAGLTIF